MTAARTLPAAGQLDQHSAGEFLRSMFAGLPGLVQVCAAGRWRGAFFGTDDTGLTAAAVHAALLDSGAPQGVYVRATTLAAEPAPGQRGAASDTAAVPFLWADVDYGTDGHKAGGLPPTQADAERVIAESGMPAPTTLVHSGGGLYPLWRLREPVPVSEAAELSRRTQRALQRAAAGHGWEYGTGVGDLARVLRLPGSTNRKTDTPRPCRVIGGSGEPIEADDVPLDPTPEPSSMPPTPVQTAPEPGRTRGPLDALADTAAWGDVLAPAGWTYVRSEDDGVELWRRPGDPTSEYSARAFRHNLVVHSESAGLPSGPGHRLTKGRLFAHLWHGGDAREAARDLVRAAHGEDATPAAAALPERVLDAVRAAHAEHDPWAQLVEGGTAALTARPATVPAPAPEPTPQTTQDPALGRQSRLWGNVLSADALRGEPPPEPPYVLRGLVRAGDLVALVSAAKAGKSLLTLDRVLDAVAAGHHIVYLDAENGQRVVNSRVHALGHGGADLDGLVYVSYPSVTLDDEAGARELFAFIAELHQRRPVDLVVLDTASRFLAGEENDSAPWLAMYRLALLPMKRAGIAVLRLDHLGKDPSRGARGSSAKNGDVDAVFELDPTSIPTPGQPQRLTLTCTMQRAGHYEPHALLIRGEIDGVLGHRHPGDIVGVMPVADPGDTATQIGAALDDVRAPAETGRDRARQLVGHLFPTATKAVWERAVRARKQRTEINNDLPADLPAGTPLPGQV